MYQAPCGCRVQTYEDSLCTIDFCKTHETKSGDKCPICGKWIYKTVYNRIGCNCGYSKEVK